MSSIDTFLFIDIATVANLASCVNVTTDKDAALFFDAVQLIRRLSSRVYEQLDEQKKQRTDDSLLKKYGIHEK